MSSTRFRTGFRWVTAVLMTITLCLTGHIQAQSTTVCEQGGAACQGVFTVVPTESACQQQFLPAIQDIGIKVDTGLARTDLMAARLQTAYQDSVRNITEAVNVTKYMSMLNTSGIAMEVFKHLNMSHWSRALNQTSAIVSQIHHQLTNVTSAAELEPLLQVQNETLRQLVNLTHVISRNCSLNSLKNPCNSSTISPSNLTGIMSFLTTINQTLQTVATGNTTTGWTQCNISHKLMGMLNETRAVEIKLATQMADILVLLANLQQQNQSFNSSCNTSAIYQLIQRLETKMENQSCIKQVSELRDSINFSTTQNRSMGVNYSSAVNFNFTQFEQLLQPHLESMLTRFLMNVSQRNSTITFDSARLEFLIHSLSNITSRINSTMCTERDSNTSHSTSANTSQTQNNSYTSQATSNSSVAACLGNTSSLLHLVNAVVEQNNHILQQVGNLSGFTSTSGMNQNSETELRATLATIQQQNLLLQNRLDEQDRKLNCIFKECPYSFVRNNCSCYKVINRTATWNDARYSCSTMGAHLVHVQNAEEQQTIGRQVASHYFEGDGFVSNQGFWLGGYDLKPPNTTVGVDGVWTWETTNQNLTYFNWSEGEPNNWGGTDEDCLLMTYNIGYTWNDDICTNTHVYICEIDLV